MKTPLRERRASVGAADQLVRSSGQAVYSPKEYAWVR